MMANMRHASCVVCRNLWSSLLIILDNMGIRRVPVSAAEEYMTESKMEASLESSARLGIRSRKQLTERAMRLAALTRCMAEGGVVWMDPLFCVLSVSEVVG